MHNEQMASDAKHIAFTHDLLLSLLHYDPSSGIFTRLTDSPRFRMGDIAGGVTQPLGYWLVGVAGKRFYGHRLAYFYMTGRWPRQIDHRNNDRADNRWSNLRETDTSGNMYNRMGWSRSGHKNILSYETKKHGTRYLWKVRHGGAPHYGLGPSLDEAIAGRDAFLAQHAGEFANTGNTFQAPK